MSPLGGLSSSRRESISSNHRLRLRQNASAISVPISLFAPAISMECAPEQDFEINEYYESSHATAAGYAVVRVRKRPLFLWALAHIFCEWT